MINLLNETKKHYIKVRANGYKTEKFIFNISKLKIFVENIVYIDKNNISFIILKKDYKSLKKAFPNYKFRIVDNLGIYKMKSMVKKNRMIISCVLFGIILLFVMSKIIVKVEVIHSNANIRNFVKQELEEKGIKRLAFKKNYKEIQKIKNDLLDMYPNKLEWIEIEIHGMNYIVRIEERIITVPEEEKTSCHVVSTKDALITKIIAHSGETIRRVSQYVRKGDILISGNITLNTAIKDTVCASGEVYGEVWYTVDVIVPLNYEVHKLTGKTKKNIGYETNKNKQSILRSTFENYETNNKKIFSLFDVKFYLQTENEYEIIPKTYTEEEAIKRGIKLAQEKIIVKFNDKEYIISEKVLKNQVNDSKMEMEIFIAVNELISKQETFIPEEGIEDTE